MKWLVVVALVLCAGPAAADPSWATGYDFDGDGIPDAVSYDYSGGGHCCYTISVKLSKFNHTVRIPFQLDGGYVRGLDLSNPWNFDIQVGKDGVAKLAMLISYYAGRAEPIPLDWVRTYGIRSHEILVNMRTGGIHVENQIWACESALKRLRTASFHAWEGLPRCAWPEVVENLDTNFMHLGLDGTLGSRHVEVTTERAMIVYTTELEIVFYQGEDFSVLRADVDKVEPVADFVTELGPPEAKLPYKLWGFVHSSGQWVWASRGIVLYVDPAGRTVYHVGVFTPTDVATYRRELAWP